MLTAHYGASSVDAAALGDDSVDTASVVDDAISPISNQKPTYSPPLVTRSEDHRKQAKILKPSKIQYTETEASKNFV